MRNHVFTNGQWDFTRLAELTRRPPLFAPHEAAFWDDPYIAQQMLAAHLDPEREAASRTAAVIDAEVSWFVEQLGLTDGQRMLDLGCGPGLYCARLAARGLRPTGVDLSPSSIEYARTAAAERGLEIEYVCANYCATELPGPFAAALLIYLDFSVLSDAECAALLSRVNRALAPGGAFLFDVTTPAGQLHHEGVQRWAVRPTGFWRPGPYLELTQEYAYPEANADLQQTVIVDETGTATVYRIWNRAYTPDSIGALLAQHGFQVEGVWTDLQGAPYHPESKTLGILARKLPC
jgi:SAM-dependent methyltransferase